MTQNTDPLDFTGERFTPECQREIWYEHYHRYALASRWCKGLRTLDAACGEGYGSALLAQSAASVEAIDISAAAVEHAGQRYQKVSNLNFQVADCIALPFVDNQFDCIVSFETLEHLEEQDQLLSEFRRVLKPNGFLALSSPDKAIYTDKYHTSNEFHVKELYRDELESLIQRHFNACQLLGQKLAFHSAIWSLDGVDSVSLDQLKNGQHSNPASINQPAMYFIALCADATENLPSCNDRIWLFDDFEESVYQHYHGEIGRNMAAGGIIAGLEKQISDLQQQLGEQKLSKQQPSEQQSSLQQPREPRASSWWQRLFSKS